MYAYQLLFSRAFSLLLIFLVYVALQNRLTCTGYVLNFIILGFILIDVLFSFALNFCRGVSFIPRHVPLNMYRRNKNGPSQPLNPKLYSLIFSFIVLADIDIDILLSCYTDLLFLDDFTLDFFILLLNFAKSLPNICYCFGRFLFISINQHLLAFFLLPSELSALWLFLLSIVLSGDVHPNPGPLVPDEFSTGFLSFCNWNLNSLASNDFARITLLNAENTIHKYDIISLCETSLNTTTTVTPNAIPGYSFHPLNHPSGERHGGVGIFYKESLPLRVRPDLCFDECLVTELRFGRKKLFFTVLYRNPCNKASSPAFHTFLSNFKNLHEGIQRENPYAAFFAGDINGHSQEWYADGDTNPEGSSLNELFTDLQLHQLIKEPTHFFNDFSNPSCIDIILTDQPNLVLNSGVRPSLDPLVKHQMTFCKLNFKIPPPPKYDRKVWHFKRAQAPLIKRALEIFPWEEHLKKFTDPSDQVELLTRTILNIMSNFIPNEIKKFRPSEPAWFNDDIRYRLKKQNKLFQKFKYKGYLSADRAVLDDYKSATASLIESSKENYLKKQGFKLADQSTSQKTYWKIMNHFLNKTKIPRIPPLFLGGSFIVCCKEKAKIFNDHFAKQCTPFDTPSVLPPLKYHTSNRLSHFGITITDIKDLIKLLKSNKAHGHDDVSVKMIQLCGDEICLPLLIIFQNVLDTGIYPSQWKLANVTPVHKQKDTQTVGNYRPMNALCSKILYNFLVKNNLITKHQSDFRPGESCGNQLLSLLTHEIDKN